MVDKATEVSVQIDERGWGMTDNRNKFSAVLSVTISVLMGSSCSLKTLVL